jgi:nitrogen fixation NifU-like protein
MYSRKLWTIYSNPRNVGELKDANAVGQVGNPKCGDIMKIYMRIENEIIKDIKFKTSVAAPHSDVVHGYGACEGQNV